MQKLSEFAQHAAECRALAAKAADPERRAMLEEMARTWERLSAERQLLIERQRRIADLETKSPGPPPGRPQGDGGSPSP